MRTDSKLSASVCNVEAALRVNFPTTLPGQVKDAALPTLTLEGRVSTHPTIVNTSRTPLD